jgi:RNA polymerase sigma-70 factor (ECF subfamily)
MHTQWMARIATRGRPRREDVDAELFHAALNSQPPNVFTAGLAKLIANLPPQQRGTLILVYGAGLSYDEAAEVFGVQVGTVMTRLVRSHRALAHWLEHRGLRAADDAAYASRGADAGHAMAFEPDGIYERYREERAA